MNGTEDIPYFMVFSLELAPTASPVQLSSATGFDLPAHRAGSFLPTDEGTPCP
jgi:hypothetical protein